MEIQELQMGDAGKYQVVLKNKIGEVAQEATLSLSRKYIDYRNIFSFIITINLP